MRQGITSKTHDATCDRCGLSDEQHDIEATDHRPIHAPAPAAQHTPGPWRVECRRDRTLMIGNGSYFVAQPEKGNRKWTLMRIWRNRQRYLTHKIVPNCGGAASCGMR